METVWNGKQVSGGQDEELDGPTGWGAGEGRDEL